MPVSQSLLRHQARQAIRGQTWVGPTVLSCLLAVQDALGWIPTEGVEEVAQFTDSTLNDVWAVASFYTNFHFEPPAISAIEICWGASCHVTGAVCLATAAMEELGLSDEGKTPDGKMSLRFNTCLGACSRAPVVSVNGRLRGPMYPERLRAEVVSLMKEGPELRSSSP